MERKVSVLLRMLFLLSSFEKLSHGSVDKGPPLALKHHMHTKEAITETFQVDGHIINCVDLNEQPSLEHPLLINHTLQMKPTYYPKQIRVNDYLVKASHPWNLSKSCPEGSIPIQGNGYFRENPYVSHWYKDPSYSLWQRRMENQKDGLNGPGHEHSAIAIHDEKHDGIKASISVWNPKVDNKDEFSVSYVMVMSVDRTTSLVAGWMVYPKLYGEDKTRFFIFWTANNNKIGCYNLQCPGFVQTNHRTILDSYLQPVSVYEGQQYAIDVEIFKDRKTGNWWLRLQGAEMGYWPKEIVPSLQEGAGLLEFGGEVLNLRAGGAHTGTQMGSGHSGYEGLTRASFFKNIQILQTSSTEYVTPDPAIIERIIQSPRCYDLHEGRKRLTPFGYFFFYGGPGRSDTCK